MFTAISRRYDLNNRLHSLGMDQRWRRRTVRLCNIGPNDDVLDVACGTGDLTLAFAQAGVRSVTGVDFSQGMLDVAAAKARHCGTWARPVRFMPGDAMNLQFEDASFNVVSIAFGIRNVSDPKRAIAEFRRVLRPGGRLAILEFSDPRNGLLRAMHHFYTRRIMPVTATWIARDCTGAYRYLPKSVETFLTPKQLSDAMVNMRFTNVWVTPMTYGVCTAVVGRVEAPRTK